MKNNHTRAKRGEVKGWSKTASRNNTKFLRSVYVPALDGAAVAFTLTIRDCPPTSDDWHKIRRAFVERLRRAGMVRLHWLTEWQKRGVPHLHGIAYFPAAYEAATVVWNWTAVAEKYGANIRSQHVVPITDMQGWFMYLAKHAGRSETHYQRNPEFVPAGWAKRVVYGVTVVIGPLMSLCSSTPLTLRSVPSGAFVATGVLQMPVQLITALFRMPIASAVAVLSPPGQCCAVTSWGSLPVMVSRSGYRSMCL